MAAMKKRWLIFQVLL